MWVATAIAVVGAATSYIGAKKAEKSAKKQSRAQADVDKKVTAEEVRVLQQEARSAYGETVAGYAGGGVQVFDPSLEAGSAYQKAYSTQDMPARSTRGGMAGLFENTRNSWAGPVTTNHAASVGGGAYSSPLAILAEQASEYNRQINFTQDVGAANAQSTLARGKSVADQYRYSGYANVASTLSSVATRGYEYGKSKGYWG